MAGTHNFEWVITTDPGVITATNLPIVRATPFKVFVISQTCSVTSVIPSPIAAIHFDIGEGAQVQVPLPSFTVNPPECAPFVELNWQFEQAQPFVSIDSAKKVV